MPRRRRWLGRGLYTVAGVGLLAGSLFAFQWLTSVATRPPGGPQLRRLTDEPRTVKATRGTITSVVVLDGVVAADPPELVVAEAPGTITEVLVRRGERVDGGQPVAVWSLDPPGRKTLPVENSLAAPFRGVVTEVLVLEGQSVAIGDPVVGIAPRRFQMVAPVEPALLYRLYERPESIRVAIDHGPAPFRCPFLSLGPVDPTHPFDSEVELRCRIPSGQHVFAGVRGKVGVTTGRAVDAVVIPVSAVEGQAARGTVTVVHPDGRRERRRVKLGLTDGVRIEVVQGIKAGERILDLPLRRGPAASA